MKLSASIICYFLYVHTAEDDLPFCIYFVVAQYFLWLGIMEVISWFWLYILLSFFIYPENII